ncbi:DUF6795 domain-containing protein [Microbulbifer agarilyticus]
MHSFNPLAVCTFSEMQLSISHKGKPVAGAKITRTINWRKTTSDNFTTDSEGKITLPAQLETHLLKFFPMEFMAAQQVIVQHDDEDYEIWNYAKRDYALNSEMHGAPLKLHCELSAPPTTKRSFGSILSTRCKLAEAL